jgi:DNA-directed RNA polymerase subunit beta'
VRIQSSSLESRGAGIVKFENLQWVAKANPSAAEPHEREYLVALNRHGELLIVDEAGRERERYGLTYGAKLYVREGEKVEPKRLLSEWDAFSLPILTEVTGVVKYGDVIDGVTMQEQLDEHTGLSRKVIIESKDADTRPRITIKDEGGKTKKISGSNQEARYFLPVGANISAAEGDRVEAGDIIARIPRETVKTKDITGGLPRVAELFEARKPKEHSVISEIDGVVSFGRDTKGKRKVIITPEIGEQKEYLISKGKHLSVREGDRVRAGEPLMDGSSNPHDILKVLGEKALAKYLVDEVQEVYRLQGVKINDKHIEVIVRQMLRRIRVIDVGDTNFLVDEQVERHIFEEENERVMSAGLQPAKGEPLLLGITKASLSTESFISASSFQETTKVLTEAAICGKVDYLRGLKENVIMGRLIPAGTGIPTYKKLTIEVDSLEDKAASDRLEPIAVAASASAAPTAAPASPTTPASPTSPTSAIGEIATGRDEG